MDSYSRTLWTVTVAAAPLTGRVSVTGDRRRDFSGFSIFLPLSLLTGLLGINVGGIPGAENKWAFLFVTFFLVMIAFLLIGLFRRVKWL